MVKFCGDEPGLTKALEKASQNLKQPMITEDIIDDWLKEPELTNTPLKEIEN